MRTIVPILFAITTLYIGLSDGMLLPGKGLVNAQVVPDGTLPTSVTSPNDLNFTIDGGSRSGHNLFHSFRQFSVPTGGSASFNNATDIQNIFSRVTGSAVSNIDGLLQANGSANLFLLNPNGILFGPNASLNIGGSFLGTTANSLQFADGGEFSSVNANGSPLLTMSVPIGLQMGQNSGAITVQNTGHLITGGALGPLDRSQNPIGLQVNPGKTLALIGGSVDLTGGVLTAPGGQITLGSVQSGTLGLNLTTATPWQWHDQQVQTWGDIRLQQQALVDVSGVGPASIQLLGRNISLKDQSIGLLQNLGAQPGGDITVRATESLNLSGISADGQLSSRLVSQTFGGGGGNINVQASDIFQDTGARMTTQTFSPAPGGNLILNIAGTIHMDGYTLAGPAATTWNSTASFGPGRAGDIRISSQNLSQSNGAELVSVTFGTGRAGDLDIRVADTIDLANSQPNIETSLASITFNSGGAGNVTVDTARLLLRAGGVLAASTLASGKAGDLTINASQSVTVSGTVPGTLYRSRILANAEKLSLISQQAFGLPEIPTGSSGSLTIQTPQLQIIDGGEIAVRNDGPGNAGNLTLRAQVIDLNHQGRISASTTSGMGGDITLSSDRLVLRNQSLLVASAGGTGNGGSINLLVPIIVGVGNSDIIANAVQGRGGNISISTQGIFGLKYRAQLTPDNDITASSEFGVNGSVDITTLGIDPNAGLVELPVDLADPSQKIAQGCAANQGSSFIVTGRGGMNESPTFRLHINRPWADLRNLTLTHHPITPFPPIPNSTLIQATGWRHNGDGSLELFATTPAVHSSLTAGLTCAGTLP